MINNKKYKVRFTQNILCYKAGDERELEKKEYDMLSTANAVVPICDFTNKPNIETHALKAEENTMKKYEKTKRGR